MVAGLNVIVFTIIAVLAHREKKQKKGEVQFEPATGLSDSSKLNIGDSNEKKLSLMSEDVAPVLSR